MFTILASFFAFALKAPLFHTQAALDLISTTEPRVYALSETFVK